MPAVAEQQRIPVYQLGLFAILAFVGVQALACLQFSSIASNRLRIWDRPVVPIHIISASALRSLDDPECLATDASDS